VAESGPKLILVGQTAGGFGVRGEVRVTAFTADPLALTAYGPLLRADGTVALTLTSARAVNGRERSRPRKRRTPCAG
jgi:ribosomal 30S subunit maturation factor RimM